MVRQQSRLDVGRKPAFYEGHKHEFEVQIIYVMGDKNDR
jgi:hypothetical protein